MGIAASQKDYYLVNNNILRTMGKKQREMPKQRWINKDRATQQLFPRKNKQKIR